MVLRLQITTVIQPISELDLAVRDGRVVNTAQMRDTAIQVLLGFLIAPSSWRQREVLTYDQNSNSAAARTDTENSRFVSIHLLLQQSVECRIDKREVH